MENDLILFCEFGGVDRFYINLVVGGDICVRIVLMFL